MGRRRLPDAASLGRRRLRFLAAASPGEFSLALGPARPICVQGPNQGWERVGRGRGALMANQKAG